MWHLYLSILPRTLYFVPRVISHSDFNASQTVILSRNKWYWDNYNWNLDRSSWTVYLKTGILLERKEEASSENLDSYLMPILLLSGNVLESTKIILSTISRTLVVPPTSSTRFFVKRKIFALFRKFTRNWRKKSLWKLSFFSWKENNSSIFWSMYSSMRSKLKIFMSGHCSEWELRQ